VDEMRESERKEFHSWYETVAKTEVFDNRRMLEIYCQADVAVLREARRTVMTYSKTGNNRNIRKEKVK
jgi:hypothetical protein